MTSSPIVAALYILCMLFLIVFGAYVLKQSPHNRANRLFAWLSLALLGWVGTLFAFGLIVSPVPLIWVGRANFAAMVYVLPLTYLFTRAVSGRPLRHASGLWIEVWFMAAISALTPLIDRVEAISHGVHVTTYGLLFPLYIAHIAYFIVATIYAAIAPKIRLDAARRKQLTTVGVGIAATIAVSLVTNLILPYFYGNFDWINIGPISAILFLAAAGYAVFFERLFDVHVVIRATVVYAGIIALALELYSLLLDFLAKLLPLGNNSERDFAATGLVLAITAFSQQPLSEWLERELKTAGRRLNRRRSHPAAVDNDLGNHLRFR